MTKQITEADLKKGAKFKFANGTIFLILEIKKDKFNDVVVRTKLAQECFTNTYLNEISDCVSFFNEEKAQAI